ncbi:4'-phosphopantetheinyl transferase superfamily protein [Bifidobacterium sp. ESL0728]|uniref:holo-ACP synthase n=1 Tax=Bifidobacterium sp. ESL0728 TaxID=2983220 RepID=UPI0023F77B5D|nr:4'-phosphopantetheinyl transferase superfamily protein [Bifidobacterium sp. ESL0728]WEV58704.1 4'-phosphopantetheinyl transferase superfamily protein [Bifidobacterium sp. ESL0728]
MIDVKVSGEAKPHGSLVLGLGHDVVDVADFAQQLDEPGSRGRLLFSARELRQASVRARLKHDDEAAHLAVRWAGKEAVLKAWCEALGERPNPYTLDDFPWAQVEILDDSRSRPRVVLVRDCEAMLLKSLGANQTETAVTDETSSAEDSFASDRQLRGTQPLALRWHVSLSHDGPVASAVAVLVGGFGL